MGSFRRPGSILNSTFDVISPTCARGRCTPGTSRSSVSCPTASPLISRTSPAAACTWSWTSTRTRAWSTDRGTWAGRSSPPFNRTGTSRTRVNDNKSQYNALQVKLDRRFRNGFLVTNSYTLGRSMDLANENTGIGTPIDFDLSWARSDTDRTHNYVLSSIYELPWGPGKKWLSDGVLGQGDRRLAAQRPPGRAVRPGADHRRQRHAAEHAGQQRVCERSMAIRRSSATRAPGCSTSTRRSTRCRRPGCRAT